MTLDALELSVDLDELRATHGEARDAALDAAGRLAEFVANGPFDPDTEASARRLAVSLTDLLRQERRLRRAIRMAVAG